MDPGLTVATTQEEAAALSAARALHAAPVTSNVRASEHEAAFFNHFLSNPGMDLGGLGSGMGSLLSPALYTPPASVLHGEMGDEPYFSKMAPNPHLGQFLGDIGKTSSSNSLFNSLPIPPAASQAVMSNIFSSVAEPGNSLGLPGLAMETEQLPSFLSTTTSTPMDAGASTTRKRNADAALISPGIPTSEPKRAKANGSGRKTRGGGRKKGSASNTGASPAKKKGKAAGGKKTGGRKKKGAKKASGSQASGSGSGGASSGSKRSGGGSTKRDPLKRAEQNRRASRRYREKAKMRVKNLEDRIQELEDENRKLRELQSQVGSSSVGAPPGGLQNLSDSVAALNNDVSSSSSVQYLPSESSKPPSAKLQAYLTPDQKAMDPSADPAAFQNTLINAERQERVERARVAEDSLVQLLKEISPADTNPMATVSASNPDPFGVISVTNPLDLSEKQLAALSELRREHTTSLASILRRRAAIVASLRDMMREHIAQLYAIMAAGKCLQTHPATSIIASLVTSLRDNFSEETRTMDQITARFYSMLSPAQEARWLIEMCNARYCRFAILLSVLKSAPRAPVVTDDPLEAMILSAYAEKNHH